MRLRRCSLLLILLIPALFAEDNFAKDNRADRNPVDRVNSLFQVSTLDALSLGIFQGAMNFRELEQRGDFGVGTFDSLDGEMVALDGRFYQVRSNGTVSRVPVNATTPFAAVTTFRRDWILALNQPLSYDQVAALIDQALPSKNLFYAVKIHGIFTDLTARSVPRQSVPFPPLATAIAQQSLFPFHNISGTLVGFRSPAFVKGINQTGYHFHFISDDQRSGGHALSFVTGSVMIEIGVIRQHTTFLPENQPFFTAPLPLP
jgi:acetolactate decarboxylase